MLDQTPRLRPLVESLIEDLNHIQWEVTRSKWLSSETKQPRNRMWTPVKELEASRMVG